MRWWEREESEVRGARCGYEGVRRCPPSVGVSLERGWRRGGAEGLREGAVGLWEGGLSRAMPSRSEGRRTFVGLTVHVRMEGGLESCLQSSPAVGLTVTEAEVYLRGEVRGRWVRGREASCGAARGGSGVSPVVWCLFGVRVVKRWDRKDFARGILGLQEKACQSVENMRKCVLFLLTLIV